MHLAVRRCTIPQHPPTEVHLFLSTVWAQDGSLCWAQVLLIGKAAEGDTARPREEYNRRPLYVGHKARSSNRPRPSKHEQATTWTFSKKKQQHGRVVGRHHRAHVSYERPWSGRGVEMTSPYPHCYVYCTYIRLFGTAYNRILDGEKRADEKIPPNARRFSRFCQTQRQQNAKFVLRPVKSGKRLLARFSVPRVPSKRVSWTRKQTGPIYSSTRSILPLRRRNLNTVMGAAPEDIDTIQACRRCTTRHRRM